MVADAISTDQSVNGFYSEVSRCWGLFALQPDRTQCIYGKRVAEKRYPASQLGQAQRVPLERGHYFDGDYTRIAAVGRQIRNQDKCKSLSLFFSKLFVYAPSPKTMFAFNSM
ncbi:AcvB/VirJ family lysyl-phosphatidylglycerol hydrolase [Pseudochelatococcus sp. G4_1912]|uniref:AcvB/VirJ family lysyl-phosphatidylglycerol hydrolase n=1 Tax=Pseudochelatococcus sp. G4_1912 TaxID=3114288 RepID=UPI0039C69365